MIDLNTQQVESVPFTKTRAFYVWVGLIIFTIIETILIFALEPLLRMRFPPLDPDTGASDYYWQLNVRDALTMVITWTFYAAHQASVWLLIIWVHNHYKNKSLDTSKLLKFTTSMAVVQVMFTLLHLLQTHIWYDGLAQDVPIFTSQGSVIVMLSLLIVMQNPRRGWIFGKKSTTLMRPEVAKLFNTNHQLIFSWALVYTFWFHPMDSSPALLSGFFFMGLLFTQMTLAYTRIHVNKWWVLIVESHVAIHGTIVAIAQWTDFGADPPMWPMFLLGFTAMIAFTYIHGLGLSNRVRWLLVALYFLFVVSMYIPSPYGFGRPPSFGLRMEFLWIPIIIYLIAFIAAFLGHLYLKYQKKSTK
jgi:hypothetical protein